MRVHQFMLSGAALLLSTAVGAFAGQAPKPTPSAQSSGSGQSSSARPSAHTTTAAHPASQATRRAEGRIVSVSDTSLVLEQRVKGKMQQETYALNGSTKRSGNLQPGARATVRYQSENNAMVATSVTAQASKSSASSSTSHSKSSSTKPGGNPGR